jgi:hypothetical protein
MNAITSIAARAAASILGCFICCAATAQTQPERWTIQDLGAFELRQGLLSNSGQVLGVTTDPKLVYLGPQASQLITTNVPGTRVISIGVDQSGDAVFQTPSETYYVSLGQAPQSINIPGRLYGLLDSKGGVVSGNEAHTWVTDIVTGSSTELTHPDGSGIYGVELLTKNGYMMGRYATSSPVLFKLDGANASVVSEGPFYGDRSLGVTGDGRLLQQIYGYADSPLSLSGPQGDTSEDSIIKIEYTGQPYRGRVGHAFAAAINSTGNVVGSVVFTDRFSPTPSPAFAFITGKNGEALLDLNSLARPSESAWLEYALDINDHNQVLAVGSDGHTYLLTPVPEPGALLLVGCGALTVLFMRRKRGRCDAE